MHEVSEEEEANSLGMLKMPYIKPDTGPTGTGKIKKGSFVLYGSRELMWPAEIEG